MPLLNIAASMLKVIMYIFYVKMLWTTVIIRYARYFYLIAKLITITVQHLYAIIEETF